MCGAAGKYKINEKYSEVQGCIKIALIFQHIMHLRVYVHHLECVKTPLEDSDAFVQEDIHLITVAHSVSIGTNVVENHRESRIDVEAMPFAKIVQAPTGI